MSAVTNCSKPYGSRQLVVVPPAASQKEGKYPASEPLWFWTTSLAYLQSLSNSSCLLNSTQIIIPRPIPSVRISLS